MGRDVVWRLICKVKLLLTEYVMETSETVSQLFFHTT